jgi:flagellar hook-associated protein 2
MATTGISFQGITSGLQTDQLISAIMAQESLPLQRLKDKETANTNRKNALSTLQSDMTALATSLQTLQYSASGFSARSVSSSDADNTYVTATANGAAPGNYDLNVTSAATRGRLTPTLDGVTGLPTNLAVADPNSTHIITSGTTATFAVQGTDGTVKTFTIDDSNNSLYGLRDAINASQTGMAKGAGVTASVVNTGQGDKPYQLVITANSTGTGSTQGLVTLADVTGGGANNLIGIAAGTVDSPTKISNGLYSAQAATDAKFSVNGIQMTRSSNTVTDAVDGVTFNIKQGSQTGTTSLTVSEDTSTITTAMQDVVNRYNTLIADYKKGTTALKDSDGNIIPAALSNDPTARNIMNQVRTAFRGIPPGLSPTATYHSTGDIGITSASDGTLSLNTTTFQKALTTDPTSVMNLFAFSGTTTNGVATFQYGGAKTTTGNVDFNISSYDSGTGNWSGTVNGIAVTGTKDGNIASTAGTSIEGLMLHVTGTGAGTLTLTKGAGQLTQDAVSNLTSYQGTFWNTLSSIDQQNKDLDYRISQQQSMLDKRQATLQDQFSRMETLISQMRASSGSLSSSG